MCLHTSNGKTGNVDTKKRTNQTVTNKEYTARQAIFPKGKMNLDLDGSPTCLAGWTKRKCKQPKQSSQRTRGRTNSSNNNEQGIHRQTKPSFPTRIDPANSTISSQGMTTFLASSCHMTQKQPLAEHRLVSSPTAECMPCSSRLPHDVRVEEEDHLPHTHPCDVHLLSLPSSNRAPA